MTGTPEDRPHSPNHRDPERPFLDWIDQQRRTWHIALTPDRLVLSSGNDALELPAAGWARDIYVAPHGDRYIVRFETFDLTIGFVIPREQAARLLKHISKEPATPQPEEEPIPEKEPGRPGPLIWPKVSPLAVWALISSALAFVPVLGLPATVATVVLLVVHRRTVRRARAWDHSRGLCAAAFVFLTAGILVSAISTTILVGKLSRAPDWESYPVEPSPPLEQGDSTDTAQLIGQSTFGWLEDVNWGLLAAGLLVVLVSLTFHEAAHATTAWWLGDDLARRLGRVTLNPRAHIDPIGTVLLPLILFLADAGVFGWAKPVPVRTEVLDRPRRGHILISLAGPGANLLLASASMLLLLGLGGVLGLVVADAKVTNFASFDFFAPVVASGFPLAGLFGGVCTVLKLGFIINVFLACFNLIPIPPLDGSWVLEHMFPFTLGPIYQRIRPYGFLLFLALLYTGVLKYLLMPVALVVVPGFLLLEWCTVF